MQSDRHCDEDPALPVLVALAEALQKVVRDFLK
jgi:hypothetical protein